MSDAAVHPTPQELTAFGLGKLSEENATTIANHLSTCTDCRGAVAAVAPDSFVRKLRTAQAADSILSSDSETVTHAPQHIQQDDPPAILDLPPELVNHPKFRILGVLARGGRGVV